MCRAVPVSCRTIKSRWWRSTGTVYSVVSWNSQTPCCRENVPFNRQRDRHRRASPYNSKTFQSSQRKSQVKAYSASAATLADEQKRSFQNSALFSLFLDEEITPRGVTKSLTNGFRFAHWSLPPFVDLMRKSRSLQSRGSYCDTTRGWYYALLFSYPDYIIPRLY